MSIISNKIIVKHLERCIILNLDDRIRNILSNKSKVISLSKSDLMKIARYMSKKRKYSFSLLEYIYIKSDYKDDISLTKLLGKEILIRMYNDQQTSVCKFLLSHIKDGKFSFLDLNKNNTINSIVKAACERGRIEILKILLSDEMLRRYPTINPACESNHCIKVASDSGHIKIVKFLLSDEILKRFPEADINPTSDNNACILYASGKGHLNVLKFLLSKEIVDRYPLIDPSSSRNIWQRNNAIKSACRYGYVKILRFLLSKEIIELYPKIIIDYEDYGEFLMIACQSNHIDVVKFLLGNDTLELFSSTSSKTGRYPHIDNVDINQILGWASGNGHINIVKILLSREVMNIFPKIDPRRAKCSITRDISTQIEEIVRVCLENRNSKNEK